MADKYIDGVKKKFQFQFNLFFLIQHVNFSTNNFKRILTFLVELNYIL